MSTDKPSPQPSDPPPTEDQNPSLLLRFDLPMSPEVIKRFTGHGRTTPARTAPNTGKANTSTATA